MWLAGPAVQLGTEEKYYPCCHMCYRSNVLSANEGASIGFASGDCAMEPEDYAASKSVLEAEKAGVPAAASAEVTDTPTPFTKSKSDDEEDL